MAGSFAWRAVLHPHVLFRPHERELSRREPDAFIKLSTTSDPFGGGHTGRRIPPYCAGGTLETRTVFSADRKGVVVLVTTGNPTFDKDGPRRQLLGQLSVWVTEMKAVAEKRARASRGK